tara:strand:- start:319 stop:525 length:207 start_codon:yes stop_codon:yes gene_type:complete
MSTDDQQRGLAALIDIRRRLEQHIRVPADDTDDLDAEVLELIARQKKRRYDPNHPVMRSLPRRRDIDG